MFFDEGWWYKDDVEKQEKLLKVVSKLWNSYWQSYEQCVSRAWVLLYVFSLMISDLISFYYSDYCLIIHCLSSSMKRFFMASFSSLSFRMKLLTTSSKACSAFTLICALPARMPDESSVFGSSCLLKLPSLILLLIIVWIKVVITLLIILFMIANLVILFCIAIVWYWNWFGFFYFQN